MTIHVKTRYLDDDAILEFASYDDGSTAIRLWDLDTAELLSVPTVRLDSPPGKGNVYIKNYSENEGMLQTLQDNKVIGPPVNEVKAGFTVAFECPLLVDVDG